MGKASRKRSDKKGAKEPAKEAGDEDTPGLDGAPGMMMQDPSVDPVDLEAGKWAREKMSEEVARLDAEGQKIQLMKTLKLFVEHDTEIETYTNCIEVGSDFDFNQVTQLLLSTPEECPVKPGFSLVKVVAVVEHEKPPILLPYLYDATAKNKLTLWAFINSNGNRSTHEVQSFDAIS